MIYDLDELLDDAVLEAALQDGRTPALAARQFGAARVVAAVAGHGRSVNNDQPWLPRGTANVWSPEDVAYLARWSGVLGTAELAARLGRTPEAISTQQFLRGLPRLSTHPDYVTGLEMARALGIDGHIVIRLIERGLLRAEMTPFASERVIWRMKRGAFYAWATNPLNWVYFWRSVEEPSRLADEKLRRLIALRRARWLCHDGQPDSWWTPGQAAAYHGVSHIDINRYIRHGRLPAVKWDNWRIRRSEVTRPGFRVYRLEDGHLRQRGTAAMDAFLVLAIAVGIPAPHISRMMGGRRTDSGVVVRHRAVVEHGLVPWLAEGYGLPVQLRDGLTWADWREAAHRFPLLARTWARLAEGKSLGRRERGLMAGVLGAFLRRHAPDAPRLGQGDANVRRLREVQKLFEEMLPVTVAEEG